MSSAGAAVLGVGFIVYAIFLIAMLVLWVYGFILFVKVTKRGIKALDIYLNEKEQNRQNNYYTNENGHSNTQ
jgi:hypothetical protein